MEEGCRLIDYLVESGEWKSETRAVAEPVGLTQDQANVPFRRRRGVDRGQDQGPVPRAAGRAEGDPRGVQPHARKGLKAETGERPGGRRLADLGQPHRHLLHGSSGWPATPASPTRPQAPRRSSAWASLGAGQMGAGIATAAARRASRPRWSTSTRIGSPRACNRAEDVVIAGIKIGRATPLDMAECSSG